MNEERRMKELSKEVKSGFVVIEMMSVVGKMTFRWVSSRQWHWQAESRDHWFVEHVTYDTAPTEPVPGVPLYLNIRRRWPSTSNDRPTPHTLHPLHLPQVQLPNHLTRVWSVSHFLKFLRLSALQIPTAWLLVGLVITLFFLAYYFFFVCRVHSGRGQSWLSTISYLCTIIPTPISVFV